MKEQITIHSQSAPDYPKPEWHGKVEYTPRSVELKEKNWRMLIQEHDDGYHVFTKFVSQEPVPDIDHPMLFVKKVRGPLYVTMRKIQKDSYEMVIFFMHHYLLNRNEFSQPEQGTKKNKR